MRFPWGSVNCPTTMVPGVPSGPIWRFPPRFSACRSAASTLGTLTLRTLADAGEPPPYGWSLSRSSDGTVFYDTDEGGKPVIRKVPSAGGRRSH
jgi:hypothetical protein